MRLWIMAPVMLALLTAGCGETKMKRATTGAAGGALFGAMVGGPIGALVGAGIGGAGGAWTAEERPEIEYARVEVPPDIPPAPVRQARSEPPRDAEVLTNRQVREAQIALTRLGIFKDRIDGLYGRRTIRAVKEFQAQQDGLRYTGALDELTRRYIRLAASEHQRRHFADHTGPASGERKPAIVRTSITDGDE